jgi:dihydrodipicolinate synthase/N-acetylneuraminate lyase
MLAPRTENADELVSIGGGSHGEFHPSDKNVAKAGHPATTQYAPIRTRTKEVGFQVLGGSTATLLDSLDAGAAGGILAFAACAPQACQEVYLAWKDRDRKLAAEKQERVSAPSQRIVGQLGISGLKHACDFNGYYGGRARAPLLPVSAAEKTEIEGLLAGIRN